MNEVTKEDRRKIGSRGGKRIKKKKSDRKGGEMRRGKGEKKIEKRGGYA